MVPKLPIESSTDWVSFGIFWYLIVGEFLIKDTKRYQKVPKDTTKKIVCSKIFSDCVKDFFYREEVVSFGAIRFDFSAIRFFFSGYELSRLALCHASKVVCLSVAKGRRRQKEAEGDWKSAGMSQRDPPFFAILLMMRAMAPSPVTLQAVPKESMAM